MGRSKTKPKSTETHTRPSKRSLFKSPNHLSQREVTYTNKVLFDECKEYNKVYKAIDFSKSTFLGEGRNGMAVSVKNSPTLKQLLSRTKDYPDLVVKIQELKDIVDVNDCTPDISYTIPVQNSPSRLSITVPKDAKMCKFTSELVLQENVINELCDPDQRYFSVGLFKIFGYKMCNDKILSFMPKLSGGTLHDCVPLYTPASRTSIPISQEQFTFDLFTLVVTSCLLEKSQTMHNDLKPDNIFLDVISPYEKCISKNIIYTPDKKLYKVFYFEIGGGSTGTGTAKSSRIYFESKNLTHIPKFGDWGMACSYGKHIYNKQTLNGRFGDYVVNYYSKSSDMLFLMYALFFGNLSKMMDENKYGAFLRTMFLKCITAADSNVPINRARTGSRLLYTKQDYVVLTDIEFEDFIFTITKGTQRIHASNILYIDEALGSFPRYFLDTVLETNSNELTSIPQGYTESDCVCIGRI